MKRRYGRHEDHIHQWVVEGWRGDLGMRRKPDPIMGTADAFLICKRCGIRTYLREVPIS